VKEARSDAAPAPVGPYSQAIEHDGWIFVSGQIPLDPVSGELVAGEIEDQAQQVLANLRAVLEAAGAELRDVVRTTIYLIDLSHFPRVNAVYAEHFTGEPRPARATVQVVALPLGAAVEIDAIAVKGPARSEARGSGDSPR
jgi:2-iminobutanoate/2-iminopropanoate deaminase